MPKPPLGSEQGRPRVYCPPNVVTKQSCHMPTTGKPAGVLVLTCTCTRDGSVPMSTGTGLVTGTKLGTRTRTRGGFYPRVRPLGARVVRARVRERAHIRATCACRTVSFTRRRLWSRVGVRGRRRGGERERGGTTHANLRASYPALGVRGRGRTNETVRRAQTCARHVVSSARLALSRWAGDGGRTRR